MKSVWIGAALCVALLTSAVLGGDWPLWRGPEQNGVSRETSLPDRWDPDTGENLLWKVPIGGQGTPIIMGDRLYTLTRIGEVQAPNTVIAGPQTQEAIVCVDVNTGQKLWQHVYNMTQTDVPFWRVGWSNPAGDPETGYVYALGTQCTLVCLEGKTGKEVWKRQMTEEFGFISTFGGRTPTPTIDEDQLIVAGVSFGWGDNARATHRIYSFDKRTGQLRWTNGTPGIPVDAGYNTPVINVINGIRTVIFAAGDGTVDGYKARTGERLWTYPCSKRGTNASVVVEGSKVYVCGDLDNFDTTKLGSVVCLDAAQIDKDGHPKVLWRTTGVEAGYGSPALYNGRLYIIDNKATLWAFEADTGHVAWRKIIGTIGKGSVMIADNKIYIPEANGRVWVLQLGDKKPEVLSKVEIPEKLGREYATYGQMAVANARVYLQSATTLYCIGYKDRQGATGDPIPPAAKEEPAQGPATWIQVVPADVVVRPGDKVTFTARAFDAKGRLLGEVKDAQWALGKLNAPVVPKKGPDQSKGATGTTGPATQPITPPAKIGNLAGDLSRGEFVATKNERMGGGVFASVGGVSGYARVRVMPNLPWRMDFENLPDDAPPLTWTGAGGKFAVITQEGNPAANGKKVLKKLTTTPLYDRARTNFGTPDMANYTLQADVKVDHRDLGAGPDGKSLREMADAGIINQRYVLVLMGGDQKAQIHIWPTMLPYSLNKTVDFKWDPGKWYRMKLRVEQHEKTAKVYGKIWAQDAAEPEAWTLELEDTIPNRSGNPGLFAYSFKSLPIYYDNIALTPNK